MTGEQLLQLASIVVGCIIGLATIIANVRIAELTGKVEQQRQTIASLHAMTALLVDEADPDLINSARATAPINRRIAQADREAQARKMQEDTERYRNY